MHYYANGHQQRFKCSDPCYVQHELSTSISAKKKGRIYSETSLTIKNYLKAANSLAHSKKRTVQGQNNEENDMSDQLA